MWLEDPFEGPSASILLQLSNREVKLTCNSIQNAACLCQPCMFHEVKCIFCPGYTGLMSARPCSLTCCLEDWKGEKAKRVGGLQGGHARVVGKGEDVFVKNPKVCRISMDHAPILKVWNHHSSQIEFTASSAVSHSLLSHVPLSQIRGEVLCVTMQ
jgi:hypothetical protein